MSFNCHIHNYSNNHITVKVQDSNSVTWYLTSYYGYPKGGRRRVVWDFLRQLSSHIVGLWCILRDFNNILDGYEKRGSNRRPNWLVNGFRQAVVDSSLSDVPVEGYPFTWFKSLGTPRAVKERLDHALANQSWFNMYPDATLEHLVAPTLDHCPIILKRTQVRCP